MGPSDFFHVPAKPRQCRNSTPYLAPNAKCPRPRRLNRPKSSSGGGRKKSSSPLSRGTKSERCANQTSRSVREHLMNVHTAMRQWPAEGLTRVPYWVYSDGALYDEEQERIFR